MNSPFRSSLAIVAGLTLVSYGCSSGVGGPTLGLLPPPEQVELDDVQVRVFTPRCAVSGCHVGSGAPFGLDLGPQNAASNLVDVPSAEVPTLMRVQPFDAADSYLYMKLTGDPRIAGDPMPAFGGPLGAADLALVASWIDQGAR